MNIFFVWRTAGQMTVAYSCRMGERGREGAEGGDEEKGKEKKKDT